MKNMSSEMKELMRQVFPTPGVYNPQAVKDAATLAGWPEPTHEGGGSICWNYGPENEMLWTTIGGFEVTGSGGFYEQHPAPPPFRDPESEMEWRSAQAAADAEWGISP